MAFEAQPLSPATWTDLEQLFDLPGGSIVRGCWCMYYRKSGPVGVSKAAGPGNKADLRALVDAGGIPGLMGVPGRSAGGLDQPRTAGGLSPTAKFSCDEASRRRRRVVGCLHLRRKAPSRGRFAAPAVGCGARLRQGQRRAAGRGVPHRQARAQPRRLHLLRFPQPLREGGLSRGHAPIADPAGDAAPAPATTSSVDHYLTATSSA